MKQKYQSMNDHLFDQYPIIRKLVEAAIYLKLFHPDAYKLILKDLEMSDEEFTSGFAELFKVLSKSMENFLKDVQPGFLN